MEITKMGITNNLVAMTILQLALQMINGELAPVFSRIINDKISQVLQHNDSIYIADSEQIHILDRNLRIKSSTSTCETKGCKNVMKVFVKYGDTKLVTCGTGNSGMCQTRNVTDMMVLEDSKEVHTIVSTDTTKPALAYVKNDQIVIAATYGEGVSVDSYAITYAITTRWLEAPLGETIFAVKKYILVKEPPEYLIFFKAVLESNGFVFLASNQKKYFETRFVDSFGYVPKLIEICSTDIVYDPSVRRKYYISYTDIELKCEMDNERYNLIEDTILVDYHGEQYFIGTFASGEDPEQNSGARVICATSFIKLQESLKMAQKDFKLCKNGLTKDDSRRYLPNNLDYCQDTRGVAFNCSELWQTSYYYVIGTEALELTPIYKHPATSGSLSKLFGRTLEPGLLDIHIGTSDGRLIQMNFLGLDQDPPLEKYHEVTVHPGFPIVSIQEGPDNLYVVSEKKIVSYEETNCSEFKTCAELMHGRNPLCGWCVLEGRSQRKNVPCAENMWLSSLKECVSLTLDPAGKRIQSGSDKKVTLQLSKLDITSSQTSFAYECEYRGALNQTIAATGSLSNNLQCTIPDSTEPSSVTLSVWVKVHVGEKRIFLASSQFLYFECGDYKSCGKCAALPGTDCAWCPADNACKISSESCSGIIQRNSDCPLLTSVEPNYIPSGQTSTLTIHAKNLEKNLGGAYKCKINDELTEATVVNNTITCDVTVGMTEENRTKLYPVKVMYGASVEIDEETDPIEVTVYRCDILGKDCSHCSQVNSTRYQCKWCGNRCEYTGDSCSEVTPCGRPNIDSVQPTNGTHRGGTVITITGKELGTKDSDIGDIMVAGKKCTKMTDDSQSSDDDYKQEIPNRILCKTGDVNGSAQVGKPGHVSVTISSQTGVKQDAFTYKEPNVTDLTPTFGPISGGTTVSFIGSSLKIGNEKVVVYYNNSSRKFSNCDRFLKHQENDVILCETPDTPKPIPLIEIRLLMDSTDLQKLEKFSKMEQDAWFYTKDDPTDIIVDQSASGILSGGNIITMHGKNLNNAQDVRLVSTYAGQKQEGDCFVARDGTSAECKVPPNTEQLRKDLEEILSQENQTEHQQHTTDCTGCLSVDLELKMDGLRHIFTLSYYQDPLYNKFDGGVEMFSLETRRLILTGTNLNLVVDKNGVNVTIGLEKCDVIELTETTLECAAPSEQPQPGIPGAEYPEVNVTVGNLRVQLGYLQYELDRTIEQIQIIAGAVGAGVLLLFVIGVVFGVVKYNKVGKKAQKRLDNMEMEIKRILKEEFFHMPSTMSGVNKSLMEQGVPYHSYQQNAFRTMFAANYKDCHPLLHEPIVSDDKRIKLKQAMDTFEGLILNRSFLVSILTTMEHTFEGLILNRSFLVSILTTMEHQKKFFSEEKSNLAGNLCVILLGRMDYLQEVMSVLMTKRVEESTGKRAKKTLFKRCESITEKLLNNWLYLCQYPHVKASFGSPLYLMFKAMQLTIESGPIDAVTEETKYKLTEKGLLHKWNNNSEEDAKDPKFEAKPLTLNVVVDHGQDMFTCKVLDCDTITQVKHKCMTQIYVSYPASQLKIDPEQLHLEWHEGFAGSLKLKDEDNTSARDGEWLRINTLAHYSVKDNAKMTLCGVEALDPQAKQEGQESYVNLAQIHVDVGSVCKGSMDPTERLTDRHDEENPQEIKRWHLVKPDTDSGKQEKFLIAELYLNRLFTTKQCVTEYLRPLFDVLLSKDTCPPTTMFLYRYMDDLAEKNKVDQNTVHLWKSHSYIIQVLAKLVQRPSDIFDVDVPRYVESSMKVLGEVLIDSCCLTPQKHTKDSPPQKLIFMNEVNQYRDKVRNFFQDIQNSTQRPEDLREYLTDINKLQLKECQFNKMPALYRFYQQLVPYLDDIIEDLKESAETSHLELDKKFQQVIGIMEAEDEK